MRNLVLGLSIVLLAGCATHDEDLRYRQNHQDKLHLSRVIHDAKTQQRAHKANRHHRAAHAKPAQVKAMKANNTLTLKKEIKQNPSYADIQKAIKESQRHNFERRTVVKKSVKGNEHKKVHKAVKASQKGRFEHKSVAQKASDDERLAQYMDDNYGHKKTAKKVAKKLLDK